MNDFLFVLNWKNRVVGECQRYGAPSYHCNIARGAALHKSSHFRSTSAEGKYTTKLMYFELHVFAPSCDSINKNKYHVSYVLNPTALNFHSVPILEFDIPVAPTAQSPSHSSHYEEPSIHCYDYELLPPAKISSGQ